MTEEAFIEVDRVTAGYVRRPSLTARLSGGASKAHIVLRDVSLSLNVGDHLVVFGAEGSGKSTLLRMLAGGVSPLRGTVHVNGSNTSGQSGLAATYVASSESEPRGETAHDVLHSFGVTHGVESLPARIAEVAEDAAFGGLLERPVETLSHGERIRLNIARALLSPVPLMLLDDVADELGVEAVKRLLTSSFANHTVIIATRNAATAEALELPLLLLHNRALVQRGTREEIASAVSAQRVLEVWVEGLRYDLYRALKKHAGVASVQLLPSSSYAGQKLRIVLHSSRFLPSVYDHVSQSPVVRVEEIPPSLQDILQELDKPSS